MITSTLTLRLWRVYSPRKPSVVAKVWAHDETEAVLNARSDHPQLARLDGVRGFPN